MREQVAAHLGKYFGPGAVIWKNTEPGKTPIDLLHFPANDKRSFHTVTTLGLCEVELKQPAGRESYRRQEFILYLPGSWKIDLQNRESPATWCLMRLFFAARYSEEKHPLAPGEVLHTEAEKEGVFGRFPYFVIIPPLGEVPEFFPARVGNVAVDFNLPVLITEKEAEFLKKNGLKALIEKMTEVHDLGMLIVEPWRLCTFEQEDPREKAERMKMVDEILAEEFPEEKPLARAAKHKRAVRTEEVSEEPVDDRTQEVENAGQKAMATGCIISTLIFVAMAFWIGSNSYNAMAKSISRLVMTIIAIAIWIGFPFVYSLITMKRKASYRLPD